jgi:hypothetical protein
VVPRNRRRPPQTARESRYLRRPEAVSRARLDHHEKLSGMLAIEAAAASGRSGLARWLFDWQGLLSLAATIVLVVVTIVYVKLTRDYVALTRRLSDSTDADLKLTREALDQTNDALKLERARWNREMDDRERWQAKLVSCRFQLGRIVPGSSPPASDGRLWWIVENDSPTSVDNVRPFYVVQGVLHRVGSLEGVVVPRGGRSEIDQEPIFGRDLMANLPLDATGISFRDNAGRWWGKWANGDLRVLGDDHEEGLKRPARLQGD